MILGLLFLSQKASGSTNEVPLIHYFHNSLPLQRFTLSEGTFLVQVGTCLGEGAISWCFNRAPC